MIKKIILPAGAAFSAVTIVLALSAGSSPPDDEIVTPIQDVARPICYSSLSGKGDYPLVMHPFPVQALDLNVVCANEIKPVWYATGFAKGGTPDEGCKNINNVAHGGGYTSFVSEATFREHSEKYPGCNPANAMICCTTAEFDKPPR